MATANVTEYDYRIPEDVIPTAETKVKLAGEILISPLGKSNRSEVIS